MLYALVLEPYKSVAYMPLFCQRVLRVSLSLCSVYASQECCVYASLLSLYKSVARVLRICLSFVKVYLVVVQECCVYVTLLYTRVLRISLSYTSVACMPLFAYIPLLHECCVYASQECCVYASLLSLYKSVARVLRICLTFVKVNVGVVHRGHFLVPCSSLN
jgi:hypothetical protein